MAVVRDLPPLRRQSVGLDFASASSRKQDRNSAHIPLPCPSTQSRRQIAPKPTPTYVRTALPLPLPPSYQTLFARDSVISDPLRCDPKVATETEEVVAATTVENSSSYGREVESQKKSLAGELTSKLVPLRSIKSMDLANKVFTEDSMNAATKAVEELDAQEFFFESAMGVDSYSLSHEDLSLVDAAKQDHPISTNTESPSDQIRPHIIIAHSDPFPLSCSDQLVWPSPLKIISELNPDVKLLLEKALMMPSKTYQSPSPIPSLTSRKRDCTYSMSQEDLSPVDDAKQDLSISISDPEPDVAEEGLYLQRSSESSGNLGGSGKPSYLSLHDINSDVPYPILADVSMHSSVNSLGELDVIGTFSCDIEDVSTVGVKIPSLNSSDKANLTQRSQAVRQNVAKEFKLNLKRLEEVEQKLDKVPTEVRTFLHFLECIKQEKLRELYKGCETGSLFRNYLIFRNGDKELVLQWLRKPSNKHPGTDLYRNISLLSMVGHGGMARTTLLQHVYGDEETEEFDLKTWVCVSNNFDVKKVIAHILEYVKIDRPHSDSLYALQNKTNLDDIEAAFNESQVSHVVKKEEQPAALDVENLFDIEQDKTKWVNMLASLSSESLGSEILVTNQMNSAAEFYVFEMLVQFNEFKVEPPHVDWGKLHHVVIWKPAIKIFDPGGSQFPFERCASTESRLFVARGV